eukprot:scaffold71712_cov19-Tisochrysis_lutea.AAC.4
MPITTHALQAAVSFALQTMPITIYALQAAVSFALQSMPVTIHAFQAALSFAFKAMPIANHAPQCLFSVALLAHYQCFIKEGPQLKGVLSGYMAAVQGYAELHMNLPKESDRHSIPVPLSRVPVHGASQLAAGSLKSRTAAAAAAAAAGGAQHSRQNESDCTAA